MNKKSSSFIRILATSLLSSGLLLVCPGYTAADVIGVPFQSRQIDGSTASGEPFNGPSNRFQQVYASSAFSSIANGGGLITSFDLKSAPSGHAFTATLPSVEILMSTTLRGPDSLSPVFADNLGSRTTTVFSRGVLTLQGTGGGDATLHIALQTPYYYNPTDGNLLLEIRNYAPVLHPDPGALVGPLATEGTLGDAVSRVYAYDVSATTGTTDTLGLLTFFGVTPVPEPSTISLFAWAAGTCGLWWCLKNRSAFRI